MKSLKSAAVASTFFMSALAGPAIAEVLSSTNPTIRNNLCVGAGCLDTETFNAQYSQLTIKNTNTRILFDDTSTNSTFPSD